MSLAGSNRGLRANRLHLGLTGAYGLDLGLTGTNRLNLRLAGVHGLYLRLAGAIGLELWIAGLVDGARQIDGHGTRHGGDGAVGCEGPRCGDDRGTSLVLVEELLAVLSGLTLVLDLGGHGRDSGAAHGRDFGRLWTDGNAAATAVVGDAVVVVVVDDDGAVVDVVDACDVYAIDGTVVVEVVAVPITAVVTRAGVAEAIVNTAVEADMGTPETVVEAVAVAKGTPVAGCPEGSGVGSEDPGAGNPVEANGGVVPIAGCPKIVGGGGFGLLIGRERRRGRIGFESLLAGVYLVFVVLVIILIVVLVRGVVLIGGLGLLGVDGSFSLGAGLGVLFGALLTLILLARGQGAGRDRLLHCGLLHLGSCRLLLLGSIDGSHVGVGWIGAGVIGSDVCVGRFVAACDRCDSGEGCDSNCEE